MMTYPGGKGNIYQHLINRMPPHDVFVSGFLGHCAVMRHKRPARVNIGIDIDASALALFDDACLGDETRYEFRQGDTLRILKDDDVGQHRRTTLLYLDPPYLMETRSSQRDLYRYELATVEEHEDLLKIALMLPCMVMISGYESELYRRLLCDWRTSTCQSMTRGGTMATEWIWMNYPAPDALHDYRYLGDTFRERERIKRRRTRWTANFRRLPRLERLAMLQELKDLA